MAGASLSYLGCLELGQVSCLLQRCLRAHTHVYIQERYRRRRGRLYEANPHRSPAELRTNVSKEKSRRDQGPCTPVLCVVVVVGAKCSACFHRRCVLGGGFQVSNDIRSVPTEMDVFVKLQTLAVQNDAQYIGVLIRSGEALANSKKKRLQGMEESSWSLRECTRE